VQTQRGSILLSRTKRNVPSGAMSMLTTRADRCDVMFLHSMGQSSITFEPVIELLGESLAAWAPDLWGHGDTPERSTVNLDRISDDLASLLSGGRAVVVVGVSYGGVVAQFLAARHPQMVSALVLSNTFARWPAARDRLAAHRVVYEASGADADAWRANRGKGVLVADASAHSIDLYRRASASISPASFFATAAEAYAADTTALWQRIRCPATVVTGSEESRIPIDVTRHLADLAQTEPVVIPGADHLCQLDRPQAFVEIVRAVATGLGRSTDEQVL
jgi:3-oxoadipate enol-lactonase